MKRDINKAFENYIKKFDMTDEDINYKYKHSYRVKELIELLSKNLSEEDKYIASIIGLYHDIGRFEQDKRYDSFADTKEFDHGDYGEKVLIEEKLIEQIPIDKKYYNIIVKAVKNHNKYKIEEGLKEKELLHAKLIRDADKLDILRSASLGIMTKKAINPEEDDFIVNEEMKKDFFNNKQIEKSKYPNRSTTETVIKLLALIYDINFEESKKYIIKNNIVDELFKKLKHQDKYKEYFDHIKTYLERG